MIRNHRYPCFQKDHRYHQRQQNNDRLGKHKSILLLVWFFLLYIVSDSIAVIAWLLGRRSNTRLMWEWGCTDTICCLWVRCPSDGAVAADSTCLLRFSVNRADVWLKTWDKTVDHNGTFICKSLTSYFHSASTGWYKTFVCGVYKYKWSLTSYVQILTGTLILVIYVRCQFMATIWYLLFSNVNDYWKWGFLNEVKDMDEHEATSSHFLWTETDVRNVFGGSLSGCQGFCRGEDWWFMSDLSSCAVKNQIELCVCVEGLDCHLQLLNFNLHLKLRLYKRGYEPWGHGLWTPWNRAEMVNKLTPHLKCLVHDWNIAVVRLHSCTNIAH